MIIIDNKTFRLSANQYYHDVTHKSQIYLHHTVGGSAASTFKYWNENPEHVGTAYLVERNGVVYEVFDPIYWAHHLGLKTAQNTDCNKRSIGIEICSEGAIRLGKELNESKGVTTYDESYLYAFDGAKKLYHLTADQGKFVDLGYQWRGYRYFDAYDEPQLLSVFNLCSYLCERFGIIRNLIPDDKNRFDVSLSTSFEGILTHCNVREDKSDVHPLFPWGRLINNLKTTFQVPITLA